MKSYWKITFLWFLLGLLAWLADTVLDYLVFYKGQGDFLTILITDPPSHELYIRLIILISFLSFGFLTSRMVKKLDSAKETLSESGARLRYLSSRLLSIQEEERSRTAKELHDSIGQIFLAIRHRVDSFHPTVEAMGDAASIASVDKILLIVQQGIEETRRISAGLRPSILDYFGIIASVDWLCEEFEKTNPICSAVKEIGMEEKDIPESLKIKIFRIVQEALNNVAKHSKATRVCVSLKKADDVIELTVRDNGIGFNGSHAHQNYGSGFGLTSMKERTELSGGVFSIESGDGTGTTVRACWPCEP